MKTRNLLFALALPAVFAACSQDEFVTDEGGVSLAGRKSLGKISLITDGDAITRWSAETGIAPEDADAMSAALIDAPATGLTGSHDYAYDNYGITDYISSNYQYVYSKTGNTWDSKAEMVEGNYIFLAPYVNHSTRKPMEATLIAEQNLTATNGKIDEKSAIKEVLGKKVPMLIAHRFIKEGDGNQIGANFYSIYSYPKITVKNADNLRQSVIVKKVILKKTTDDGFTLNAPFSNKGVRNALLNEVFEPQGTDTKDQALVGSWAAKAAKNFGVTPSTVASKYTTANAKAGEALPATLELTTLDINGNKKEQEKTQWMNGLSGKTSDLLGTPTTKSEYIVINFPANYVLKYGEEVSFNAVIPADDYQMGGTNGSLEMYVVVNNETANGYSVDNVWKKNIVSRSQQLTLYPGKLYPEQDYSGTELRQGRGGYFTILAGSESVQNIDPSVRVDNDFEAVGVVTTTEELKAAVANIQSNTKQVIVVNGKNVEFNSEVNEVIARTDPQDLTIQGLVYINADNKDKAMTIANMVKFTQAVVKGGEVTFNGAANELGKVMVDKDATLVVEDANLEATTEILNLGTLKLAKEIGSGEDLTVENWAQLEVEANVTNATIHNNANRCSASWKEYLSNAIVLNSKVRILPEGTYKADKVINYAITVDEKDADDNVATLALPAEVTFAKNQNGEKGTITNNGIIEAAETSATLTVPADFSMVNAKEGTIKNSVSVTLAAGELDEIRGALSEGAKLSNGGKIEGTITLNVAKDESNDDVVDVRAGRLTMTESTARVATVSGKGEVDNTKAGVLGTVENDVEVYATGANLSGKIADNASWAEIRNAVKEGKITVIRITGAWDAVDGLAALQGTGVLENVTKFQFDEGSSLNINSTATLNFGSTKVEILGKTTWNGRTTATTVVSANTLDKVKYYGVTKNTTTGKYEMTVGKIVGENVGLPSGVNYDN